MTALYVIVPLVLPRTLLCVTSGLEKQRCGDRLMRWSKFSQTDPVCASRTSMRHVWDVESTMWTQSKNSQSKSPVNLNELPPNNMLQIFTWSRFSFGSTGCDTFTNFVWFLNQFLWPPTRFYWILFFFFFFSSSIYPSLSFLPTPLPCPQSIHKRPRYSDFLDSGTILYPLVKELAWFLYDNLRVEQSTCRAQKYIYSELTVHQT